MPRISGETIESGYGRPYLDTIDITAPAAGATASYTVTGEFWVRVVAALATLSTDSNAASRVVSIDYLDPRGVTRVRNTATVTQPASKSSVLYAWTRNRTGTDNVTDTIQALSLLDQWLPPGWVVKFAVTSIQVGDTLTALSLLVEKWNTGPMPGSVGTFDAMPPR